MTGLQAADILPLLKEKIAFLPGKVCPGSHSWAEPDSVQLHPHRSFFLSCQRKLSTLCGYSLSAVLRVV